MLHAVPKHIENIILVGINLCNEVIQEIIQTHKSELIAYLKTVQKNKIIIMK